MDTESLTSCTLCGKPRKDILILTEVAMEVHSRYQREDGIFENMNGLRKQTREYLCEDCFQSFVDKFTAIAAERRPVEQNNP
jgi:hypothetical protein